MCHVVSWSWLKTLQMHKLELRDNFVNTDEEQGIANIKIKAWLTLSVSQENNNTKCFRCALAGGNIIERPFVTIQSDKNEKEHNFFFTCSSADAGGRCSYNEWNCLDLSWSWKKLGHAALNSREVNTHKTKLCMKILLLINLQKYSTTFGAITLATICYVCIHLESL